MELSKENFRALGIIFYALLAGMLLYAAITVFLISSREYPPEPLLGTPMNDLLCMGGYVMAMIFFARFIDGMWQKQIPTVLRMKRSGLAHYRANVIIRLAIIEGGGLFSVTFALLSGNLALLLVTLLAAGAMWLVRPTEEEFLERYDETLRS